MFRRTHVLAIVTMAVGVLLGYAAASGKWNPLSLAGASAAPEGQALSKPGGCCTEGPSSAPCCSEGATRELLVARADEQAQPQAGGQPAAASGKKPNILVIFGDDIGIPQISAYTQGMMG